MATQEPNVYAGLAVVIGGLMHARPRFFAKVMGELLFWVGEDKMLFGGSRSGSPSGSRGAGRVGLPGRDVLDFPAVTTVSKKKIMGLNAAKLYGVEVPAELRLPEEAGTPAARTTRNWLKARRDDPFARPRGARHGLRPRA